MLPPAVLSFVRSKGACPAAGLAARPLTTPTARRAVYYVPLADGEEIKVRLLPRWQTRRRMEWWLPRLKSPMFPLLIAASGRIVIEQWLPGRSLNDMNLDANLLEASGQTLAAVHETSRIALIRPRDLLFHARLRRFRESLQVLRAAGAMSAAAVRVILENAMNRLPRTAHWGLIHRDFSRGNLILREDRVCSIDNVDMARGFLEEDLAITFFHWPMTAAEQGHFLRGYGRQGVADSWMANRSFWTTLALVAVAAWRQRSGWPNLREPIGQLSRQHLKADAG
jgi:hypothetical protein